jgi:hypothetical protein
VKRTRFVLENQILKYIDENRKYIEFVVKKKQFLREEWEDLESYIILELIKFYPKKYKYPDDKFDWVTRTIIRRKVIDYVSNHIKKNEGIIFENEIKKKEGIGSYGKDDDALMDIFVEKSLQNNKDNKFSQKILDYVKSIKHQIDLPNNRILFDDEDREFIDMVLDLYESGCDITKEDLQACSGFDESQNYEFNVFLNKFRGKMNKYFILREEL